MSPVRPTNLTGADQVVRAGQGYYCGFSVRETGGAAAVVRLYDNASAAAGPILEEISLAANESAREQYYPGVWCTEGIYVDVVSGAVAGSVRVG